MSTANDIQYLEIKRNKLIAKLLETRYMLRGTFKKNFRRCGKSTCWCASAEKGHPYHRITGRKDAQGFTKSILKEDLSWAKEVTHTYKQFRKMRQELRTLNERQRILLNQLEDEVVEKTKQLKDYL